jgi:hypothetical protein
MTRVMAFNTQMNLTLSCQVIFYFLYFILFFLNLVFLVNYYLINLFYQVAAHRIGIPGGNQERGLWLTACRSGGLPLLLPALHIPILAKLPGLLMVLSPHPLLSPPSLCSLPLFSSLPLPLISPPLPSLPLPSLPSPLSSLPSLSSEKVLILFYFILK